MDYPSQWVQLCQAMTKNLSFKMEDCRLAPPRPWPGLGYPPQFPLEPEEISPELLGLLLSQQLAQCHGGHVKLLGNLDAG